MFLRAEQYAQLRAAAFSSDEATRLQHGGVALWIEEFLTQSIYAKAELGAREVLGLPLPEDKAGMPDLDGGDPWMRAEPTDDPDT